MGKITKKTWKKGKSNIAVIMISLNEEHNIRDVLDNLTGWAAEVYLIDSGSSDKTIDIAIEYGIKIFQRPFTGFGDQWNFAIKKIKVSSPWSMKLDPDERLTDKLKSSLIDLTSNKNLNGIIIKRRLWFLGKLLPVNQKILRLWKSGECHFTNVEVNEYPIVRGNIIEACGFLEHRDSPNLDHWVSKQNKYSTLEAINLCKNGNLAFEAKLFGSNLERRMWIKKYFWFFPFRYQILFIYHYIYLMSWKAGKVGFLWSILRTHIYRLCEHKIYEIKQTGNLPNSHWQGNHIVFDKRVKFFNNSKFERNNNV